MNSNLNFVSSNIRRLRKSRRWTQEELAKRAHISRIALIHIENGKALPTLETLSSLSQVFGVSLPSLLYQPRSEGAEGSHVDLTNVTSFTGNHVTEEIDSIVHSLRDCSLKQVLAIRRVIDSIISGFTHESLNAPSPALLAAQRADS